MDGHRSVEVIRETKDTVRVLSGIVVRFGCGSDTDSNRAMPTARETSKTQTLGNKGQNKGTFMLRFM